MSGYWGHAIGVITVLLLIAFLAIWVWAWLPRHKRIFERMARLPLEGDDAPPRDENATRRPGGERGKDDEGGEQR